jgi:penicillin-binding protein 2
MSAEAHPLRVYALGLIFLMAFTLLGARLWYVQIARGEEYPSKIRNRSQVTVRLPAVRGEILDRNGIKLVENRGSFEVDFDLPELVRAYREEHGRPPMTSYRGTVRGMPKIIPIEDVEDVVERTVIPRLQELGLAQNYNSSRMQVHYQRQSQIPFNYMQNVDFETMVRLTENNLGLPGVRVEVRPIRHYPLGALASHILGYTGMPNEPDIEEAQKFNFYQPDVEGRAQIELYMNDALKGTAGVSIRERDVKGNITGEVNRIEPKQGANVYLTIDARLQFIVEEALRVVGRGAAVVIDPNNGNILAMASVPSFDPNVFIPSIKAADWTALTSDRTDPLVNRAISGYAPGSTYKIPISLAGLRAGVTDRRYSCSGGVQYGKFFMRCHGTHGSTDLEKAIKVSCNSYYYLMGNAAGIDQIVAVGNMLGLGQRTGIPLSGEAAGILPGREWLAQNHPNHRWSSGYTANTAIGQGFVLTTPLQMAVVAATLANGGITYFPRLVDRVVEQDGTVLEVPPVRVRSNLIVDGGLTEEQIQQVRSGMRRVVHEAGGTAMRARVPGIEMAGKTGTAQFMRSGIKDNRAWFMGFAPYDEPRFAFCVMVEGAAAGGGALAAPIIGKIIEDALKLDEGGALADMRIETLAPAVGHFENVASIDFGRAIPAATTTAPAEAEPGGGGAPMADVQTAAPSEAPSIRPEADARGNVEDRSRSNPISNLLDNLRGSGSGEDSSSSPARPPRPRRR